MSDHRHYVPVLKGRAGEFDAVARLDADSRAQLTPLFEFPDDPEADPATLDERIGDFVACIRDTWGRSGPVLIDMVGALQTADGQERVEAAMDWARRVRPLDAIPVIALGAATDVLRAVASAVAIDAHGVGIRARCADVEAAHTLEGRLDALLCALGAAPANSHLILDLEQLPLAGPERAAASAQRALQALQRLESWRSVTVVSAGFPNSLAAIRGERLLPRNDWLTWRRLIEAPTMKRLPAYGDYAASGPGLPAPWASIPNIRYTAGEHWYVVRDGRKHDSKEFHRLALQVRQSRDAAFCGFYHCYGCEHIVACSVRGDAHPGNARTWRGVATCHHLTVVVEQLSALAAAS